MLDLLGNVFGRSKKSSSQGTSSNPSGNQNDEDFVYVPENNVKDGNPSDRPPLYPAIQLTDSMLREGVSEAGGTWNSHSNASHPFSLTHKSPLDNVPFVPNIGAAMTSGLVDIAPHFVVVDRVSSFLNSHASQYHFDVEQSVLRESA